VRAPPLRLAAAAFAAVALAAFGSAVAQEETPREPGLSDVRWELAPMRVRGLLSADLRRFTADGQPARSQAVETAALQAVSYVYQPWFAQVAFGVNGLVSQDRGDVSGRSNALGGNALLNVFPTSRFPFQGSFERSDTRASDQFTGQDYTRDRIMLRQSYRNLAGDQTTTGRYDRSTLTSTSFGRDTVDVLGASYARRMGDHGLDGDADRTLNSRSTGEHSQFDRIFGRHRFNDEGLLNIETLASYGASNQTVGPAGALTDVRTETTQLNSFGTWRPADDDPLYITGGARLFQVTNSDAFSETETRTLTGNGAATYRLNRNVLLNGGGSLSHSAVNGANSFGNSQFAGGTYTIDPRRWSELLYTANVGLTVNRDQTGPAGAHHSAIGQGTHGLQRVIDLDAGRSLMLNGSQALSFAHDSVSGPLTTLTNYGAVSYRLASANQLTGYASLSASDSRTRGFSPSTFQLVNLQFSGQGSFGRYSSLSANYTVQGARQTTGGAGIGSGSGGFDVNQNGGITYQHARAFGLPLLRYLAIYQRNDFLLASREQGDPNAPREHVNWSFEQRLEYRVGRLELRASYRLVEVDGKKNALLFLRLAREFGN